MHRSYASTTRLICVAIAAAAALQACGDGYQAPAPSSSPQSQQTMTSVSMLMTVSQGGTLSISGAATLTIPPAALNKDTTVTFSMPAAITQDLGPTMTPNGDNFYVAFSNDATLTKPMTLKLPAAFAPQHPQIAELAMLTNTGWQRVRSNFYRSSDRTVIGLTTSTGLFRVVNRSLQRVSGASVTRGRDVFLYETFGNEAFFGGVIKLHDLLNNLKPVDAVGVGVQIDLARVPANIAGVLTGTDYAAKGAALQNPAITRALIKAGAVVGVKGTYADPNSDMMTGAGITCAICHVNVTPTSFQLAATGPATPLPIGQLSIDGIPNANMDAGKILSLTSTVQALGAAPILAAWGPGAFDIRALPDNPLDDGVDNPTQYPPLWNFLDLEAQGYIYDWDGLFVSPTRNPDNSLASQAEAVYDLVMHANGAFGVPGAGGAFNVPGSGNIAPQLRITPPTALVNALVAAESGAPGNVLDTQKLLDVQDFQRSIVSPAPGAFDAALAEQGFFLFNDSTKGNCVRCHSTAEFTGRPITKITARPLTGGLAGGIKTPGLRGIARTAPFFADGSAKTLKDAVKTYVDQGIVNPLTDAEQTAIAEYLKSL